MLDQGWSISSNDILLERQNKVYQFEKIQVNFSISLNPLAKGASDWKYFVFAANETNVAALDLSSKNDFQNSLFRTSHILADYCINDPLTYSGIAYYVNDLGKAIELTKRMRAFIDKYMEDYFPGATIEPKII